jgi:hypothetical protein
MKKPWGKTGVWARPSSRSRRTCATGSRREYEVDDDKQPTTSGLRLFGRGPVKGFLSYTVAFYLMFNVVDPEEEAAEEEAEKADGGGEGRPSMSLSRQSDGSARRVSTPPARVPISLAPAPISHGRARNGLRRTVPHGWS